MARILLVEDDLQVSRLLRIALEEEGHTVLEAHNGKEGLKELAGNQVDVIVTDIIMPEMDGIEILRQFRRAPSRPRIIAISGGTLTQEKDLILKTSRLLGADAVMAKPVELQELIDTIHTLLSPAAAD